jgi:hypothetical protein
MSAMTRLLAIALVVVSVLPVLIFATDFTNSSFLRSARQRTRPRAQQAGALRQPAEADSVRREQVRVRRARIHPTALSITTSMTFQMVMLIAIAVVGRRLFALRL